MTDETSEQNLDRKAKEESGFAQPFKEKEEGIKEEKIKYDYLLVEQEQTRSTLAIALLICFGVTILLIFVMIGYYQHRIIDIIKDSTNKELNFTSLEKSFELSKEIITIVWTSQAALLGSALGFYFGNRNN